MSFPKITKSQYTIIFKKIPPFRTNFRLRFRTNFRLNLRVKILNRILPIRIFLSSLPSVIFSPSFTYLVTKLSFCVLTDPSIRQYTYLICKGDLKYECKNQNCCITYEGSYLYCYLCSPRYLPYLAFYLYVSA